jgi:LL-diaminopimelate aminotransferase
MGIATPSKRLEAIPPYKFQELEQQVADKRAAGIDVISLGIGDPDLPTPEAVVEAAAAALRDPSTHQYPSNRGSVEFREAATDFYRERFGVELDPASEVMPVLGGKEAVGHIAMACLEPGDLCLSPEPGYPPYTSGPVFSGAEVHYLPLTEENHFFPELGVIPDAVARRANLLYLDYPNNPTGAIVPEGAFEQAVVFARQHDVIVVHDNAYSEITFDGYVAPSFLDARDFPRQMSEVYQRRRDLLVEALAQIGLDVEPPKATPYFWVRVPEGHTSASFASLVLDQANVVVSPGPGYGPSGEGFVRLSLTVPDERLEEAVRRIESSLRASIIQA